MSKTATFIKKLDGFTGDARLFRLDPPAPVRDWDDEVTSTTDHVVVSAVHHFVTETYIFPAEEDGTITDWGELEGSYRGGTDHSLALANAGYTIA